MSTHKIDAIQPMSAMQVEPASPELGIAQLHNYIRDQEMNHLLGFDQMFDRVFGASEPVAKSQVVADRNREAAESTALHDLPLASKHESDFNTYPSM